MAASGKGTALGTGSEWGLCDRWPFAVTDSGPSLLSDLMKPFWLVELTAKGGY